MAVVAVALFLIFAPLVGEAAEVAVEGGWTQEGRPVQLITLYPKIPDNENFFHPFVLAARISPKAEALGGGVSLGYRDVRPHFRFSLGLSRFRKLTERLANPWEIYIRIGFEYNCLSIGIVHWSTGKALTGLSGNNLGETGIVSGCRVEF